MHIVYLASWYPQNDKDLNGCFFREQAHALSKAGSKIGVIAPQFRSLRMGKKAIFSKYGKEIWQDDNVTTYLRHNVFLFPKVPYLDLNRWVKCCINLFDDYVKTEGLPDVIHVQSMTLAGVAALIIHKKYKVPYCIMEHSTTFGRGLIKKWHYNYLNPVVLASVYNMAVSKDLANLLMKKFEGTNWHYFPNLLDKIFNYRDESINVVNKQFCAVGALVPKKGFDVLLNSFAQLLQYDTECSLIIAGSGPEQQNLKSLAKSLGIEKSVKFLGSINREQVKTLMAQSSCYVLSSHIETFGVVVIEALSQGTPVISTRCGGPESILTTNDGIFVDINNVNALTEAMLEVLKQPNKFDRQAIRQHCLDRYSEATFITNMLKVYQACIGATIIA